MSVNILGARAELPRVAPESAGVSSAAIETLIDELEAITEPHSLMVARGGKVCFEGWWSPYSPAVKHMLASHSKGYSATAIGILVTQGKLSPDDLVCEIIPEYMPENMPENLKKLRVRHLLTMTTGMTTLPNITKPDWERAFFRCEFTNEPGTTFFYSGNFTAMLCVIARKVAGCGMMEFLSRELFCKIGIDPRTIKWMTHADGLEYGGGGMITLTENNLRLGLLYIQGGVWGGERILSREWVEDALSVQYKFDGAHQLDIGYGYQTWTAAPHGSPRFDGAGGQYTIMCRAKDVTVSITETGPFNVNDVVLAAVERFTDTIESETLPEDASAAASLAKRASMLCIPGRLGVKPVSPRAGELCGRVWRLPENRLSFMPEIWGSLTALMSFGFDELCFEDHGDEMTLTLMFAGRRQKLSVSMDGLMRLSRLDVNENLPDCVYAEGLWTAEDTLALRLRVIEAACNIDFSLRLADGAIEISNERFNMLKRERVTEVIKSL